MKILHKNKNKKEISIIPENLDDLWIISQSIEEGDLVSSFTERKIKLNSSGDERKTIIIKKKILLQISVEKIEFHKYTGDLRISGKITQGKEDISAGSYHTLNIELGNKLDIEKKEWFDYQIKRIEEYSEKKDLILICTLDRESATIFKMLSYGYEVIAKLKGDVQKKDLIENKGSDFFEEVISFIDLDDKKSNYDHIVIASPQFWHSYLSNYLKKYSISKKTNLAVCNAVGENGVKEILRSTELNSILNNTRSSKEIKMIDELLRNIHQEKNAVYGFNETQNSIFSGSAKDLMITEKFIQKNREEGKFTFIENLLKTAEQVRCDIHIISSEHEGGKNLDGLGGIAAITRY